MEQIEEKKADLNRLVTQKGICGLGLSKHLTTLHLEIIFIQVFFFFFKLGRVSECASCFIKSAGERGLKIGSDFFVLYLSFISLKV